MGWIGFAAQGAGGCTGSIGNLGAGSASLLASDSAARRVEDGDTGAAASWKVLPVLQGVEAVWTVREWDG